MRLLPRPIPEGKISPSLKVITGRMPRTLPATDATFPIRPPCLRYSMSPTVKKILPLPLISSRRAAASSQPMPLSRNAAASSTKSPCSTVFTQESMTVIRASGYSSRTAFLAFTADCMEPLNLVVIQIQITGIPCSA